MQIFDQIVKLLIGISWPLAVVLLTAVLRKQLVAALVAVKDRISSADAGELTAGPVALRWSGAIAAVSSKIEIVPTEFGLSEAVDGIAAVQLPAVGAPATPVKSIVDSYELVRVTLLAMSGPADNSGYLVGADAAELAVALRRTGDLAPELADAIQVLSDMRGSILSETKPSVSMINADEYVDLARAILARLPSKFGALGAE
jgi:hypothetical protein